MKQESVFVAHLAEVFRHFGAITWKSMFGGYGLYHRELMFGLIADDVLYLKVDSTTIPEFTKAGSVPFEYIKNGKRMKMSYYSAPDALFDDTESAKLWADRAFGAAQRAKLQSESRKK